MLIGIKIESLFERFSYDITFKSGGVTIITGPNGFGKSTLLKFIESISNEDLSVILDISFKKIEFIFSDNSENVTISKVDEGLKINGLQVPLKVLDELALELRNSPYIHRISKNRWYDVKKEIVVDVSKFILKNVIHANNSEEILKKYDVLKEMANIIADLKKNIGSIYYVKEQRLIMEKQGNREEQEIVHVIQELPNNLKNLIRDISNNYSTIANKLDSTYPNRLFSTEVGILEKDYTIKMEEMNDKFDKLSKYDISEMQHSTNVVFKDEHAKALRIYFDDFDQKYKVYEKFIAKLDLFTSIVNSRLNFKEVKISRENGITVVDKDNNKKLLNLNQLSSGEKQEIVLFFELIFEAKNNSLLLIDEPEISLHITWQKMFMDDLLKIVENNDLQVIVATHSPQIINNHWERQIDLGGLYSAQLN